MKSENYSVKERKKLKEKSSSAQVEDLKTFEVDGKSDQAGGFLAGQSNN